MADQTLRQARERAGLKQKDVAAEAGCSTSLVCMVENGYRPKGDVVLGAIALAVGASYGSFWGAA